MCTCYKYIMQNRNKIVKSQLQGKSMWKNPYNNMCVWHCKILTYLRDREVDRSTGVTDNDSQCYCTASIVYKRFLLEALCNRISDHRTLLSQGIYLRQHKRQESMCLVCSMCSYSRQSSRLCLFDCRTNLMCKLQSDSTSPLGICSLSSDKPLHTFHSKQIF